MIAALLFAAAVTTSSGTIATDPVVEAKVAEVKKNLDVIQKSIDDAQEKEAELLKAIDDLDGRITAEADDLAAIHQQVTEAREKSEKDKASMEELQTRIDARKHWLASRLKALYIHGRPGYLKILFAAENYADLLRRTKYQKIVAHRDAAMVGELKNDLASVQKERTDYEQDLGDLEQIEKDARGRSEALEVEKSYRRGLLGQIEADKGGYERLKAELEQRARSLTQKIGTLAGVQPPPAKSFEQVKGTLSAPVAAPIRRPFGPYTHPKLGLPMIEQGILYAASAGSDVHAVFDGTVELAGPFSSYGEVIVIDHGDGWRSLYAHNGRLMKKQGDHVTEGDVIALSGDTGSLEGPELYFAVFREGKPVDPADWLLKK